MPTVEVLITNGAWGGGTQDTFSESSSKRSVGGVASEFNPAHLPLEANQDLKSP